MCQCIRSDVSVHLADKPAKIECESLTTSSGRTFDILRIASVDLYPSRDQLRQLRDTVDAYLDCNDGDEVPADDPSWDTAIDALPTIGVVRPRFSFAAVSIGPDDILPAENDALPGEFDEYDGPDAPDFIVTQSPGYWEALEDVGIGRLPAISGGSPDADYEPTEADRAEWSRYLHDLDSRLPSRDDQVEHYRPGMPTDDELAQLAAHGCV